MKFKTTNKAVNAGYRHVFRVGYCDLQYLLYFTPAVAYTCGVYGWKSDIYECGNVAISTGYQPTGDTRPPYELTEQYEQRAFNIINSRDPEQREKVNALLKEYVSAVLAAA